MINIRILTIFLFLTYLTVNGQTDNYKYWLLTQRLPNWTISTFNDLKLDDKYVISDFINPFYLESDFNGDNELDIAISIIQKETNKKGIIIFHKTTNEYFILGAGTNFAKVGDDFKWMDIWKVNRELDVFELTSDENSEILESKELEIQNYCLAVEKAESASGLIYWDGKKYKWAQTSE